MNRLYKIYNLNQLSDLELFREKIIKKLKKKNKKFMVIFHYYTNIFQKKTLIQSELIVLMK